MNSTFTYELVHFANTKQCLDLCLAFPDEKWPRVMLMRSLSDTELAQIEAKQEEKRVARIAQQTLHGYQIRHG